LGRIANGTAIPGKLLAKDIERATEGQITAEELLNPKDK